MSEPQEAAARRPGLELARTGSEQERGARRAAAALLIALALSCSAPAGPDPYAPLRPLRPDSLENNGWERDSDLLHLDLELSIDFDARAVRGSASNHVRALLDGTRALAFHAREMQIEGVSDGRGRALAYRHEDPLLHVELAEPLARGAEEVVRIRYRARPTAGLHFVERSKDFEGFAPQVWSQGQEEENRRWIPTWDYPNDRFTFEGRFRVGHDMQVVSNGRLVGVEEHGGGERTFHWEMRKSLPAYLIAVAAGRWEVYAQEAQGVRLEYYVGPGTGEEKAMRAFGETPAMLEFFSELLGRPFPYERYAQVAVSEFLYGGMENTTVTIQNDYIVVDEGQALDLDGDPRLLVAHELAHHWFGDLVTCLGWSHLWLNEAWASYLELRYERHAGGEGSFRIWLERYRERFLSRGRAAALPLALDWRTQFPQRGRTFHEYDKGPWVLHMLCEALGEEAFWQGTRAYLERHAEGLVKTSDFERAFFDSTGRNIEGFLEQWVAGGGAPHYRVRFDPEAARSGRGPLRVLVEQVQQTSELVPLFQVLVPVELHLADGRVERHRLPVGAARAIHELPLDAPLADIVFDADCAVLCELSLEKPAQMWAHQARLAHAGLRWRALAPLAALAQRGGRGMEIARTALEERARSDPEPLLRARAIELAGPGAPSRLLLDVLLTDSAARPRLFAARALDPERLRGEELSLLRARLGVEPSPAVRAELERLLAGSRG